MNVQFVRPGQCNVHVVRSTSTNGWLVENARQYPVRAASTRVRTFWNTLLVLHPQPWQQPVSWRLITVAVHDPCTAWLHHFRVDSLGSLVAWRYQFTLPVRCVMTSLRPSPAVCARSTMGIIN